MKFFYLLCFIQLMSAMAFGRDIDEIQRCLEKWGKTPFSHEHPNFRVISAKVKVLGIGGDIDDSVDSKGKELILIRPAVSVLSKTALNLRNPNGWYCLKGDVSVLGKIEINLNCKSHFASSKGGATVMGSDTENAGVTVLGSTRVNRVGDCK